MRDIWVISDTHFGHENILKFKDKDGQPVRDFESVEEMNETMVDRWNSVVKQGDKVYHLGDVFFGSKDNFKTLWPRLKGHKRLIVGNHDDIKFLSSGGFFGKVQMWRMFPEFKLVLTHVPLHLSQLQRFISQTETRYLTNVHGHIHQNPSPEGPYKCVCVEQTDYTPMSIEELKVE
jgi:calcineurin-like phosphoesterase family protein